MSGTTLGPPEGIGPAPDDAGGDEEITSEGGEVGGSGDGEARDGVAGDGMAVPGFARRPVTAPVSLDNAFLNPKREGAESDVVS